MGNNSKAAAPEFTDRVCHLKASDQPALENKVDIPKLPEAMPEADVPQPIMSPVAAIRRPELELFPIKLCEPPKPVNPPDECLPVKKQIHHTVSVIEAPVSRSLQLPIPSFTIETQPPLVQCLDTVFPTSDKVVTMPDVCEQPPIVHSDSVGQSFEAITRHTSNECAHSTQEDKNLTNLSNDAIKGQRADTHREPKYESDLESVKERRPSTKSRLERSQSRSPFRQQYERDRQNSRSLSRERLIRSSRDRHRQRSSPHRRRSPHHRRSRSPRRRYGSPNKSRDLSPRGRRGAPTHSRHYRGSSQTRKHMRSSSRSPGRTRRSRSMERRSRGRKSVERSRGKRSRSRGREYSRSQIDRSRDRNRPDSHSPRRPSPGYRYSQAKEEPVVIVRRRSQEMEGHNQYKGSQLDPAAKVLSTAAPMSAIPLPPTQLYYPAQPPLPTQALYHLAPNPPLPPPLPPYCYPPPIEPYTPAVLYPPPPPVEMDSDIESVEMEDCEVVVSQSSHLKLEDKISCFRRSLGLEEEDSGSDKVALTDMDGLPKKTSFYLSAKSGGMKSAVASLFDEDDDQAERPAPGDLMSPDQQQDPTSSTTLPARKRYLRTLELDSSQGDTTPPPPPPPQEGVARKRKSRFGPAVLSALDILDSSELMMSTEEDRSTAVPGYKMSAIVLGTSQSVIEVHDEEEAPGKAEDKPSSSLETELDTGFDKDDTSKSKQFRYSRRGSMRDKDDTDSNASGESQTPRRRSSRIKSLEDRKLNESAEGMDPDKTPKGRRGRKKKEELSGGLPDDTPSLLTTQIVEESRTEFLAPDCAVRRHDRGGITVSSSSASIVSSSSPTSSKLEKVKSRWRRWSELDGNGEGFDGGPVNAANPHLLNDQAAGMNAADQENKDENSADKENDHYPSNLNPQPPDFEEIDENIFLFERKKSKSRKEARRMVCDCSKPSKEDRSLGVPACGEDCLNRMLMIECGSRCPCEDLCTNRRFQRKERADVECFYAGSKGWGLRAKSTLEQGAFVMEYVGEVLDYSEFRCRAKSYTNNQHFYFMALNADEIVDATQKGNITRFINHSCDSNAETQKWTVNGSVRIGFFTTKPVAPGEEITFDYQFENYGHEVQKCYCGAVKCRGVLGKVKQQAEEYDDDVSDDEEEERRKQIRRRKQAIFDDVLLDEEVEQMKGLGGMKRIKHVIELARLMVRAESIEHRTALLQVIKDTKEANCLRLFLDYHGLQLLWSWMVDVPSSAKDMKKQILEILALLPIKDRTILQDSKILPMVQKWAGLSTLSHVATFSTVLAPPTVQKPVDSGSATPGTPCSLPEYPGLQGSSSPAAFKSFLSKKRHLLQSLTDDTTSSDSDTEVKASTHTAITVSTEDSANIPFARTELEELAVDKFESSLQQPGVKSTRAGLEQRSREEPIAGTTEIGAQGTESKIKTVDEQAESSKDGLAKPCDRVEDFTESAQICEQNKDEINTEQGSRIVIPGIGEDFPMEYSTKEDTQCEEKDSVVFLAGKLLESWADLKEQFKIPKIKVEERKKREEELERRFRERGYIQKNLTDDLPRWAQRSKSKRPIEPIESSRGKDDKRKRTIEEDTGPKKVLLPTPPEALKPKISKEEHRKMFEIQVRMEDQMKEEQQKQQAAYEKQHSLPQIPGLDTELLSYLSQPSSTYIQPTGFTPEQLQQVYQATGLSFHPGAAEALYNAVVSQSTSLLPDQASYAAPIQNYPTVGSAVPGYLDPGISSLMYAATQQVTTAYDPSGLTSSQLYYPNDTSLLLSQVAASVSEHLLSSQISDSLRVQTPHQLVQPVDQSGDNQGKDNPPPPPPSPPQPKAVRLPPNWKTARDAEGKMYYYHTVTRQTQWDPPAFNQQEEAEQASGEGRTSYAQEPQKQETSTASADSSSEVSKKLKEQFLSKMAKLVVKFLSPYRKPDCKKGRILNHDEFKALARKLTHAVMDKELKYCRHVEDLEVNDNVKSKAKDFVRKYMSRFGKVYSASDDKNGALLSSAKLLESQWDEESTSMHDTSSECADTNY